MRGGITIQYLQIIILLDAVQALQPLLSWKLAFGYSNHVLLQLQLWFPIPNVNVPNLYAIIEILGSPFVNLISVLASDQHCLQQWDEPHPTYSLRISAQSNIITMSLYLQHYSRLLILQLGKLWWRNKNFVDYDVIWGADHRYDGIYCIVLDDKNALH